MKRNALPCQSLHVRHGGVVISAGIVLRPFLQDCEYAGRRAVTRLPRRACGNTNGHAVAVDVDELLWQGHDDDDRAAWRDFWPPDELSGFQGPDRGDTGRQDGSIRNQEWTCGYAKHSPPARQQHRCLHSNSSGSSRNSESKNPGVTDFGQVTNLTCGLPPTLVTRK